MKPLSKKITGLPASAAMVIDLEAKRRAAAGENIINFCVGEPDQPSPELVLASGYEAIDRGFLRYTAAGGCESLKKAVCEKYKRQGLSYEPENIAVTTGGKYGVYAAIQVLCEPGDEVILPAPYWTSYYHIITLAGAKPVVIRGEAKNNWKITAEQLLEASTEKTKALILNNPNNPSGAVYTKGELTAIAAACKLLDIYVVADEIYENYLYDDAPFVSTGSISPDMKKRTILVNGMSKSYSMTGWRIGYAAGEPEIIKPLIAFLSHSTGCPNTIAQYAAEKALLAGVDFDGLRLEYRNKARMLVRGLSDLPELEFSTPHGAFYLMIVCAGEGKKWKNGDEFAKELLDKAGVAVVPCADYGIPEAVRLSFSVSGEKLEEGIARIRKFILDLR